MIRQDRFLLAILAGIAVLVALALILFFARQAGPAYGPEDTPQGVIQNYMAAITLKDYTRAFGYVAGPPSFDPNQSPGLPDVDQFRQFFLVEANNQLPNTGLQIGDTSFSSADLAVVSVTLLHTSGSLFNSVGRDVQQFQLARQNAAWKITQGPYPFWNYSWSAQPIAKPVPARPSP